MVVLQVRGDHTSLHLTIPNLIWNIRMSDSSRIVGRHRKQTSLVL